MESIKATPNPPLLTVTGKKQMAELATGDQLLCMDENTKTFRAYIVVNKTEVAGWYPHEEVHISNLE